MSLGIGTACRALLLVSPLIWAHPERPDDLASMRRAEVLIVAPYYGVDSPKRRAEDREFTRALRAVEKHYEDSEVAVFTIRPTSAVQLTTFIDDSIERGIVFDRLVYLGHGGYDGPIIGRDQIAVFDVPQVAPEDVGVDWRAFWAFGRSLKRAVRGDIFLGGCNMGTADDFTLFMPYASFSDALAATSRRLVIAPSGKQSATNIATLIIAYERGQSKGLRVSRPDVLPLPPLVADESLSERVGTNRAASCSCDRDPDCSPGCGCDPDCASAEEE